MNILYRFFFVLSRRKHEDPLYRNDVCRAGCSALRHQYPKMLLVQVQPAMMAALLYLGAGVGLFLFGLAGGEKKQNEPLTRQELPFVVGMIVLDVAAPILLMLGLERTTSANASLLNNFEIVATSLIAAFAFREVLSRKLVWAIVLVTLASITLSFEGEGSFAFNAGSFLVLGAACCWGLENNCTRMLSSRSSVQITAIKGIFSGLGSLAVAWMAGESLPGLRWIPMALALGFVAYGLSINFYIRAQKDLGAAKTSAYYSIAPFLGAAFSMLLLKEKPDLQFCAGLVIMIAAAVLLSRDSIGLQHTHEHAHTHTHEHRHGELVHTHEHQHVHTHTHVHGADESIHDHPYEAANDENHDHAYE